MDKEKMTLEEYFAYMDGILTEMERPDVSLDRSFQLYKEGLASVKAANDLLDGMEKAMLILNEDGEAEKF